jgi:hypothetical protein
MEWCKDKKTFKLNYSKAVLQYSKTAILQGKKYTDPFWGESVYCCTENY